MSIRTQTIQSVLRKEGRTAEEISIWLRADKEDKPLHCVRCGRFLFSTKHRVIAIIDNAIEEMLKVPPLSIHCQRCGCIHHVHIY